MRCVAQRRDAVRTDADFVSDKSISRAAEVHADAAVRSDDVVRDDAIVSGETETSGPAGFGDDAVAAIAQRICACMISANIVVLNDQIKNELAIETSRQGYGVEQVSGDEVALGRIGATDARGEGLHVTDAASVRQGERACWVCAEKAAFDHGTRGRSTAGSAPGVERRAVAKTIHAQAADGRGLACAETAAKA